MQSSRVMFELRARVFGPSQRETVSVLASSQPRVSCTAALIFSCCHSRAYSPAIPVQSDAHSEPIILNQLLASIFGLVGLAFSTKLSAFCIVLSTSACDERPFSLTMVIWWTACGLSAALMLGCCGIDIEGVSICSTPRCAGGMPANWNLQPSNQG